MEVDITSDMDMSVTRPPMTPELEACIINMQKNHIWHSKAEEEMKPAEFASNFYSSFGNCYPTAADCLWEIVNEYIEPRHGLKVSEEVMRQTLMQFTTNELQHTMGFYFTKRDPMSVPGAYKDVCEKLGGEFKRRQAEFPVTHLDYSKMYRENDVVVRYYQVFDAVMAMLPNADELKLESRDRLEEILLQDKVFVRAVVTCHDAKKAIAAEEQTKRDAMAWSAPREPCLPDGKDSAPASDACGNKGTEKKHIMS